MKQFFSLFLLCFCFIFNTIAGDEISGIIKDRSTSKVLPYATVVLANGSYGVISDESGSFRLELDEPGTLDTLVISYVGYKTLRLTAQDIIDNNICLLEPYVFPIDEVIVRPIDAEDILRKAYDDFYKNHVHRDIATYGYYREQIFEGNRCVRYGEAAFATRFFEEDGKDMAAIEPLLARSIDDSTFFKKFNDIFNKRRLVIPVGMNEYSDNDMVSNFKIDRYYEMIGEFFFGDPKKGFHINYKRRDNYIQSGRESYFITFEVKKKKVHIATGHILIDQETYGIAAFEIEFREQEDLTKLILPPKIRLILKVLGYGVNIGDYEAKLYNRYDNGKWFIGRGVQILQGGIAKRKEWINGKLVNEFHAFYSNEYKEPESDNKFTDVRVNDFSSSFWEDYKYSPIQPLQQQYIQQIVERNNTFSGEILSKRVRDKLAAKAAQQ